MSTRRTIDGLPDLKRNAEGRALCRWCQKPVPKGRQSWCSQACVDDYRIRAHPSFARHKVFERDQGTCSRCGHDTKPESEAARRLWRIAENEKRWHPEKYEDAVARLAEMGISFREWTGLPHFWEAHHITAVVEGGGECGLEGYETLCLACHKTETAALAARRAEERQAAKPRVPKPSNGRQTEGMRPLFC